MTDPTPRAAEADADDDRLPPRVVQFLRPGWEPRAQDRHGGERGTTPWSPPGTLDDLRFLTATGTLLAAPGALPQVDVPMTLWASWPAPTRWRRIEGPVAPRHPAVVHEPLLPAQRPAAPHREIDPLVLGPHFVYSSSRSHLRPLRAMPPGSVVLFGRGATVDGQRMFTLDTCLVVAGRLPVASVGHDSEAPFGQDLLADLVLYPLRSCSAHGSASVRPYRGARPDSSGSSPFSFVPARPTGGRPPGFARPVLRPEGALAGVVAPGLRQGVRATALRDHLHAAEVWRAVVAQVLEQGCQLGMDLHPPEVGSA